MPKIYEYFGLIFLIWTDEGTHSPHVHVRRDKTENVIEIVKNKSGQIIEVKKRKNIGKSNNAELSAKDLKTALKFVNAKAEEIAEAYKLISAGKFKQKPIIITRKIV